MKNKIRWEEVGTRTNGYLGDFKIFSLENDPCVPRGEPTKIYLRNRLPGLRDNFGHFLTVDLAKEKAERALQYWLDKTNLTVKE